MIQAGGNTIGPSTILNAISSTAKQKWYVSDYLPLPGVNALVAGDEIVNFEGDASLESTGTAATAIISNGVVIADAGDTTWAATTMKFIAPSSDAKLNLLILASDEAKSGIERCVNMNTQNEDGSVDRYYAVVLAANPVKKAGAVLGGWNITYQPYGVDRRILVVI